MAIRKNSKGFDLIQTGIEIVDAVINGAVRDSYSMYQKVAYKAKKQLTKSEV